MHGMFCSTCGNTKPTKRQQEFFNSKRYVCANQIDKFDNVLKKVSLDTLQDAPVVELSHDLLDSILPNREECDGAETEKEICEYLEFTTPKVS